MQKCLLCKNKKFQNFYSIKSFPMYFGALPKKDSSQIRKFPLEISYCKKCNLVQQTKKVKEKFMNEVYSSKYYNCPSPKKSGMGVREILKFWTFFKSIKQAKGKVLEIASFDGYLLDIMKKNGWDVYGCDPASASKKIAKKKFGKKIKTVFYQSGTYPKKHFDIIVFRNLLEHIYDYGKFFSSVRYSLMENGHIFIDVPNVKAIIRTGSFGVFFHQHISYFSKNTITEILLKYGFKVIKIHEGYPNLFVYASKIKKNKIKLKHSNDHIFLNRNLKKSQKISKKILDFFNNKNNNKIVLFGMSALATTIVNFLPKNLKKKIILLCDNDTQKHNKVLCGFEQKIKHPKYIEKINYDKILICSYFFKKEIVASMIDYVKDKKKISTI